MIDLACKKIKSVCKLERYLGQFMDPNNKTDFEDAEKVLREISMEIEKEALMRCLSKYDIDTPEVKLGDKSYKKVVRCKSEYQSAAGMLPVTRSLYRAKDETKAICPLELNAGIIEKHWTPSAAKQGIFAVAHMTPQEAEGLFKEIGNMEPSKSSLDRLPKKLGALWEENFEKNQEHIRVAEEMPDNAATVAISLDGIMVPMSKTKDDQPAQYKEASCGSISLYDENGKRLSTTKLGRMPEHKKVTIKTQLKAELACLLEKNPDLQIVKIADGAKDNWTFLEKDINQGTSLLDFWHMSEHLKDAFDSAFDDNPAKSRAQFEKFKKILKTDHQGTQRTIRRLKYLRLKFPEKPTIAKTLKYLRNNKHRMLYAQALERNMPIGSGVVEAACKSLVAQRLKCSGMRWQQNGAQAILSFRSLIKSNRFDNAWNLISSKFKGLPTTPVTIN